MSEHLLKDVIANFVIDEEFERFRRGIIKVKDYLFTFLSDFSVPFDNNASYPNFSFIPTFGGPYHKRLVS